jgi:anti-anti-sigma regulatory factor
MGTSLLESPQNFTIESELTARTVSEYQARLLSAFAETDAVRIALSHPIRVDVCGVQLIESARKLAEREGKRFSLAEPADADLARLLETLGVTHPLAGDRRRFWLHEGVEA